MCILCLLNFKNEKYSLILHKGDVSMTKDVVVLFFEQLTVDSLLIQNQCKNSLFDCCQSLRKINKNLSISIATNISYKFIQVEYSQESFEMYQTGCKVSLDCTILYFMDSQLQENVLLACLVSCSFFLWWGQPLHEWVLQVCIQICRFLIYNCLKTFFLLLSPRSGLRLNWILCSWFPVLVQDIQKR